MNVMTLYRIGHWCHRRRIPILPGLLHRLIFLLFNSSIPMSAEIGEGTILCYGGMGVVLHHHCRIGRHVVIAQQVTVGGRSRRGDVPLIEDHCYIGAGARILGPIRIGAGSVVGANAVVLEDVPPRSVVVGVPARVVRSGIEISEYCDQTSLREPRSAVGSHVEAA
jgi:serine O-acetyltransferase